MNDIKEIIYKKQGDGRDSWFIYYNDENKTPDLVFEDPNIPKKLDMSNVDLTTMTTGQIDQLKQLIKL